MKNENKQRLYQNNNNNHNRAVYLKFFQYKSGIGFQERGLQR